MKFELKMGEVRKKLKDGKKPVPYAFAVGYCDLQNFDLKTIGYISGVYGWNFDLIDFEDYYITTGYRQTIGYRINYKFLENCNKKIPYFENRTKVLQKILSLYLGICYNLNCCNTKKEKLECLENIKMSDEYGKLQSECNFYGFQITDEEFILTY